MSDIAPNIEWRIRKRFTGPFAARPIAPLFAFWCIILGAVGLLQRRLTETALASLPSSLAPQLESVPLQLGDWEGVDVPVDTRVLAVARTDAHLNRRYTSRKSRGAVDLYVAFTHRATDMLGHRPDVCYPANGWIAEEVAQDTIPSSGATAFDVLLHRFSHGDPDGEQLSVLNYYILPDGTTTDWNAFAGLDWRRQPSRGDTPRFVVQVQVVAVALFPSHVPFTTDALKRFTSALAPELLAALARPRVTQTDPTP